MKNKDISEIPFVFFDTETTGLKPENGARIIEIGAVKIQGGQIIGEINQLIDPEKPVPEFITKLTGINDSDVKGKPLFKDIFPEFYGFSRDCIMVAHNVEFDRKFLYAEIEKAGFDFLPWQWLDTWKLAKCAWPYDLVNYKLQTIARALKIDSGNAHRAKDDAIVCSKVFFAAIKEIKKRMSLQRLIAIEGSVRI